MNSFEFKILQYANSELLPEGTPFAVVVSFLDQSAGCIHGFLRAEWKQLLQQDAEADLNQLQGFVDDLEYYVRQPDPSALSFFKQLEDLSVGPLRIASVGHGRVNQLQSIADVHAHPAVVNLTSHDFDVLVQEVQHGSVS